jgi:hypothetical protein
MRFFAFTKNGSCEKNASQFFALTKNRSCRENASQFFALTKNRSCRENAANRQNNNFSGDCKMHEYNNWL